MARSHRARRERFALPQRAAAAVGSTLQPVSDHTAAIRRSDVLAFMTLSGPAPLLPYALAHHRKLGVRHFLIVATETACEAAVGLVSDAPDCSVWRLPADADADEPRHALNHLRRRYGCGNWCLTLAPDCLLVYPHYESRGLADLVEFLGSEGRETLFAVMLDMYGPQPAAATRYAAGTDPLHVAGYFDATGYVQRPDASYGDTRVQGGPRRRITARANPGSAPPIDAIALVKWRKDYNYLEDMRLVAPKRLNRPHGRWHLSPTGCLLRFSWLDGASAGALVGGSTETPMYDESVAFTGSAQLARLGLLSHGQWF